MGAVQQSKCLGMIFRNCCLFRSCYLLRLVALNLFWMKLSYFILLSVKLLGYLKPTINERMLSIYLEKNQACLLRRTGYPYPSKYNQIHLFHFICHHSTSCKMWCSLRHNGSRQCARGSYHLHYIKLDNNISSIWHWRINGKKFFPLSNVVHKTILMG